MKSVLHVIPWMSATMGGPPVVVDRLARQGPSLGWSSHVLSADGISALGPGDGGLHAASSYTRTCIDSQAAAFTPAGRALVEQAVGQADMVHLHTMWSPLNYLVSRTCRFKANKPYVVSPHGMLDRYSMGQKKIKKRVYYAAIERHLVAGASAMVFTSPAERDSIAVPAPNRSAYVIPLGVDECPAPRTVLAAGFRAAHPHLSNRRLLTFFGRVDPKKRPELAIEALARLLSDNKPMSLLMVGPGDERYLGDLKRLAVRLNVSEHVHFLGPRYGQDKWSILAASFAFLLPSLQENFALALAEALQAGTPSILSRNVNIWQEVVEAGAAYQCGEGELINDMVAAISELDGNEALHARMSENARTLASTRYAWRRCAERTVAAYDAVLTTATRG